MKDNHNQRQPISDGSGRTANENETNKQNYRTGPNNDENDSEFPGYPHYPASEDIMNPANQVERVPVDVEKLAPTGNPLKMPDTAADTGTAQNSGDDDIRIVPGTDADVTREDLRMLNATEGSYAEASNSATVTGEDLDVPGADADDPNEDIGEEDEENNYYSIGGDNHENLEEERR